MSNLACWNPRHELELGESFHPVEQMFEDLWSGWPFRFQTDTTRALLRPAMDVIENEQDLTVRVDLPGLAPEQVHVEVENGVLTISGEVSDTIEKEGERYHYRERSVGSFQRSVRLPNTLDAEKIDASYENGVLNVVIPKLPQAQPKQISVNVGKK